MRSRRGPLRLIHLANFNSTNIGNGALVSGLESTIEEDFPHAVSWIREPWDDYTFGLIDFDEAFVDKINRSDGLVVGGAVTFNGRDYNNRTGTRFELPYELWSKVTKPIIFYGLSYRHWPGQTYHHVDKLKATIERILSTKNMMLTVRNDGTKEWLRAMTGIDSDAIVEVPDSAVFVRTVEGDHAEMRSDVRNVIVALNDEDSVHRFDQRYSILGKINRDRDHVINELVVTLERLADRYPVNMILCPHYFDDYRMMTAVIERIRPRLAHQNLVSTGLSRAEHAGAFYARYKKADLAISMRVHSMSPCIGIGTPMIAYTTQERMTDFMSRIGLVEHVVDAFGPSAGDKLYERAMYAIENGAQVKQHFFSVREALRDDARRFHRELYEFLTA